MDLRHYAARPVTLDRDRAYVPTRRPGPFAKPDGLWVSDESEFGWAQWCREEEFRLSGLDYAHRVTLRSGTQPLCILTTADELRAFTTRFTAMVDVGIDGIVFSCIDWARVQKEFAGLIITPYQWECRYTPDWYHPWDVASGCIWNLTVIDALYPMPASEHAALTKE